MVKKEKQLEEIQAFVRGQSRPGGRGDAREGRASARMEARIKSDAEEEMEVGEVQVVEKGDHYCELCKLDLVTTDKLKSHVIRFHEANLDICAHHVVKDTCQRMASDLMKSLMKLATHIVQYKVVRVGGPQKKQRKDITKTFIQIRFRNTDVSFAHSTSLSGQCGI